MAGTFLALRLLESGHQVTIVDSAAAAGASRVAAGIMHPISFRKPSLVWKAHDFLAEASHFYALWESRWGQHFFHHIPFYKTVQSGQTHLYAGASNDAMCDFLPDKPELKHFKPLHGAHSIVRVQPSGYLDLPGFLDQAQRYLEGLGSESIQASFDYKNLEIGAHSVVYNQSAYHAVVFCEGAAIGQNPFWNHLPVHAVKGEVADIRLAESDARFILKNDLFLLSLTSEVYRIGAPYFHHFDHAGPSEQGKAWLSDRLNQWGIPNPHWVRHVAGLRPTLPDRKPVLGQHPAHKPVYVFNGLGSRGVLMAPLLSLQMAQLILYGHAPWKEVQTDRFLKP